MDLFGEEILITQTLADKYLMCPTSVLNKRDPKWSELKRKWIKLGIKSELGRIENINKDLRGSNKDNYSYMDRFKYESVGVGNTFSIFDPVLCEIIYKWFCKTEGKILDPFAGGSVRGIVANYLGFQYTGIELREEQVNSNREQALNTLEINNQPQWIRSLF